MIITEHIVKTKKYGPLKISAISTKERANLDKLLSQKINDKELYIQFLQRLLLKPKLTQDDLITLSDNVLIRIGKEIIKANRLISKYEQASKNLRLNFYIKFRKILEQENVAWKKIIDRQKLPFQSISDKLKTAFMSPTYSVIEDMRRREDEFRRFSNINSHMLSTMNAYRSLETQMKSFMDVYRMQEIQMKSALAEDIWRQREEFNQLASLKAQTVNLMDTLSIKNNITSIIDAFKSNALVDSINKLNNLISSLPLQEFNRLQALINNNAFQDFLRNSIQTAEDIFE